MRGRRSGMIAELMRSLRLAWRLLNDPRVSPLTKLAIPGLALIYFLFPLDLAPDLVPLLGQLDDLAVLLIALRAFLAFCPPEVVRWHEMELEREDDRAEADDARGEVIDAAYRVLDDDR
jgi:uncharacterized membrane protein YkvA (DUF1232 family)